MIQLHSLKHMECIGEFDPREEVCNFICKLYYFLSVFVLFMLRLKWWMSYVDWVLQLGLYDGWLTGRIVD